MGNLRIFNDKQVRTHWDAEKEEWYFSVVDVCHVLADSPDYLTARKYWNKLKQRLNAEGSELVTICHQLKMPAADGKNYKTDVLDTKGVLRLVQSIPSPKAEPFKVWLAQVGSERLNEAVDPELTIDRAMLEYQRLGYSENWINQRLKSIEVRKGLTNEWDKSGVTPGKEYADLTDLMSKKWSGMTTKEYKSFKGLKKESLRDNMTNTELILNMLAEAAATDISVIRNPKNYNESRDIAQEGAEAAKVARAQIEKSTQKPAVSKLNAKNLPQKPKTPEIGE